MLHEGHYEFWSNCRIYSASKNFSINKSVEIIFLGKRITDL
mgnify:CR=1 FL=1